MIRSIVAGMAFAAPICLLLLAGHSDGPGHARDEGEGAASSSLARREVYGNFEPEESLEVAPHA